jgi:hypothetical protein
VLPGSRRQRATSGDRRSSFLQDSGTEHRALTIPGGVVDPVPEGSVSFPEDHADCARTVVRSHEIQLAIAVQILHRNRGRPDPGLDQGARIVQEEGSLAWNRLGVVRHHVSERFVRGPIALRPAAVGTSVVLEPWNISACPTAVGLASHAHFHARAAPDAKGEDCAPCLETPHGQNGSSARAFLIARSGDRRATARAAPSRNKCHF